MRPIALSLPRAPPSEPLASECGHFVGSRLELHDGEEPNCPLRVEHRVDAFNNLEDLGEVTFDVRSRGVGLDYQTGFLEQFVARWTSRRTETPAPIGIAWISAVAFMGLEVKGLTWYRAALTAAYHAGVRPPRDRCDRTRPVPHIRLIDPIGGDQPGA